LVSAGVDAWEIFCYVSGSAIVAPHRHTSTVEDNGAHAARMQNARKATPQRVAFICA
jgi:hypothetical protein